MKFKQLETFLKDVVKKGIYIPDGMSAIIDQKDYEEMIPPQPNNFGKFGVELNVEFGGKSFNVFLINENYIKSEKL